MDTSNLDTQTLFVEYLNTCNTALDKHRNDFPYKQLIDAGDKLLGGKNLGVQVYKNDASSPHDYFTLRFDNGHLTLVSHGKQDTDAAWKTKRAYLENVVENSAEYIEHPAKLDLEWLKSRLNIS